MLLRRSARGRSVSIMGLVCGITLFSGWLFAQEKPADLILHNGKILTVDRNFSTAQAVAVTGNLITAVGSNADVMKLAGSGTQVIDLKGRTVTPGLMDTHLHTSGMEYGGTLTETERAAYRIDWRGVRTKDDVLNQISGIISKFKIPPGQWIHFNNTISFMGEGNETTRMQGDILFNQLNRWELDKAAPNNPIIMDEGIPEPNGLLVNGVALDIIMKEHGDFIRTYGRYWIDANGRPEGHLESVATRIVIVHYEPQPKPEVLAPLFRKVQEGLIADGITALSGRYPKHSVDTWKLLNARGELMGRVGYGLEDEFGTIEDLENGLKKYQGVVGTGSDRLWVTAVTVGSVDGAGSRMCSNMPKSGSGAIDSLYPNGQCYTDMEFRGAAGKAAPIKKNYFTDWALATAKYGIRFGNTHNSGDRSVSNMLKAAEEAQKKYGREATKGWAWDHCDMINPEDIKLSGRLGIQYSCGAHIEDSAEMERQYGEKVAHNFISPIKSMIDNGIRPSVEPGDTMWTTIRDFITRKDKSGKVWGAHERVDRVTALKMPTIWAAEYVLKQDKLGSIETGKLADLVVIDKDYMAIPEDEIATIQAQMTVLDGKIVYVHRKFSEEYNLKPMGAIIATHAELLSRRNRVAGTGGG